MLYLTEYSVQGCAPRPLKLSTGSGRIEQQVVDSFFEKEGIYTFDGKGELLITIMSSLAQEESCSISENISQTIK